MWAQQALCRLQLLAVFSGFHWGHGDHRGVEGHVYQFSGSCQFSSRSPDDVVYVESYVFERKELIHYDSRAGQFVGYTEYGAKVAERWNSDPQSKARVVTIRNTFCKPNLELAYDHILEKTARQRHLAEGAGAGDAGRDLHWPAGGRGLALPDPHLPGARAQARRDPRLQGGAQRPQGAPGDHVGAPGPRIPAEPDRDRSLGARSGSQPRPGRRTLLQEEIHRTCTGANKLRRIGS
ncbi:uncharacterized protein [Lepisosteus oculatus]|uniref:uncharacterized protein isoform X2 n=1 Tax=Lepisosteus oculatus TaxID=7918 RepID=UPI0035F52464